MTNKIQTDVAIIGAGSAGLHALREVRRAGRDLLLIDNGPLGTTCARVGCMPTKVALHAGAYRVTRKARTAASNRPVAGTARFIEPTLPTAGIVSPSAPTRSGWRPSPL